MARYSDTVADQFGNPVSGVQVSVYPVSTPTVLATLTDDAAAPLSNPVATDASGLFFFNVTTGDYILSFKLASATRPFHTETVNLNDAIRGDLAASGGSALIGFLQSGTGATARTVQAKLLDMPINVTEFGVSEANSAAANFSAFSTAIAAANAQNRMLYLPQGRYSSTGTLPTLTGPGMVGDGPSLSIIDHYSSDTCLTTKGSYKTLEGFAIVNKVAPGTGTAGSACFRILNCAYGRFDEIYAYHDLDSYAGIQLEQVYDGSADDAAFLAHLGCWYNIFDNCISNYATNGQVRGIGFNYLVNANAIGVLNPPGQAAGTYSGQVGFNIMRGCNIESRKYGWKLGRAPANQMQGGQFLNNDQDVFGDTNSGDGSLLLTRHNQWATRILNLDSTCTQWTVQFPSLFNTVGGPYYSLGTYPRVTFIDRRDTVGTWVPALKFGGAAVGMTTSKALGTWDRDGDVVTLTFDIRLTAKGSSTGIASIANLPFPAINAVTDGTASAIIRLYSGFSGTGKIATGYPSSSAITELCDHSADLADTHFTNASILFGTLTYIAAPL